MDSYVKKTDNDLLLLLKKGDHAAFSEIFERYKELLYRHAFKFLRESELANDVVQDLFLTLWEKREVLNLKTSLSAYLYIAIRNRILDLISHEKVATKYVDSIRNFIDQGHYQTDELLRAKELTVIIEKEIAALPPQMRKVFELSRQNELSYKDIGAQLNISNKTVKQQVYNAVKTLRLKLNPYLSLIPFLF